MLGKPNKVLVVSVLGVGLGACGDSGGEEGASGTESATSSTDAGYTPQVREGLDYVFYLSTYKYLGAGDDVGRAEGSAFYRAIQPLVAAADEAIVAGFGSGEAAAGRAALHREPVLKVLAIAPSQRVDT